MQESLLAESYQENLRLLYVALTRAQYHIYISGYQRARKEPGFYPMLVEAMQKAGAQKVEGDEERAWILADVPGVYEVVLTNPSLGKQTEPSHRSWSPSTNLRPKPGLQILAPARLLKEADLPASSGRPRMYARELGLLVHKGLESFVKNQPFEAERYWEQLLPVRPGVDLGPRSEAFNHGMLQLKATLSSVAWQKLWMGVTEAHAELPLAYINGNELIRGTLDLLLRKQGGDVWIIDYKSVEDEHIGQDPLSYIQERRYDQQLGLYRTGIEMLYPEARVLTAILFTDRSDLVFLQS